MTLRRGRQAAGGFLRDFIDFINRGSVVDLVVAVIIGAAFSKIVDSLVSDVITPALLTPALRSAGVDRLEDWIVGEGIKLGVFLAAILNFLVIALSIFVAIRVYENFKRRIFRAKEVEEAEAPLDPAIEAQRNLTIAVERLTQVIERRSP